MTQLSRSFTVEEWARSNTAQRLGIDNTPAHEIIQHGIFLAQTIMQPARDTLGPIIISSGYRCEKLNAQTPGSSNTSAHVLGYAADLIPRASTMYELARFVADNCKFDQIILEFGTIDAPAWVHVSADPRFRGQIFRKLANTGYIEISRKSLDDYK
jgi:hypothetical protein